MDRGILEAFAKQWARYFPGSELPVAFAYADALDGVRYPDPPGQVGGYTCIFGQLSAVRNGEARAFDGANAGCFGAAGVLGFSDPRQGLGPEYDFLVKEEKFYKTAEQVREILDRYPPVPARGRYAVFKRWDLLTEKDEPLVVSFFCRPDAVAGLHALANYDSRTPHGVIAPFGSGCDTLVGFALRELASDLPRAVLGLFDPSARVCVRPELLTFSVPWPKFTGMLENMDRCFLTTPLWQRIRKRMQPSAAGKT